MVDNRDLSLSSVLDRETIEACVTAASALGLTG